MVPDAPRIYIHELARRLRMKQLGDPSVGAVMLTGLALVNATTIVSELPRAQPAAVTISKRHDDDAPEPPTDGPHHELQVVMQEPAAPVGLPLPIRQLMERQPRWDYEAEHADAVQGAIQATNRHNTAAFALRSTWPLTPSPSRTERPGVLIPDAR